jgi:hypothetical protein
MLTLRRDLTSIYGGLDRLSIERSCHHEFFRIIHRALVGWLETHASGRQFDDAKR